MSIFSKKKKMDQPAGEQQAVVADIAKEAKKEAGKISTAPKKTVSKTISSVESRAHKILLAPVISEKATIGVSANKYVFLVAPGANKVEIKKAIQEVYKVVPVSINIIRQQGKRVRFGRNFGVTKGYKKAIVTLRSGESIKLYEGI